MRRFHVTAGGRRFCAPAHIRTLTSPLHRCARMRTELSRVTHHSVDISSLYLSFCGGVWGVVAGAMRTRVGVLQVRCGCAPSPAHRTVAAPSFCTTFCVRSEIIRHSSCPCDTRVCMCVCACSVRTPLIYQRRRLFACRKCTWFVCPQLCLATRRVACRPVRSPQRTVQRLNDRFLYINHQRYALIVFS
jgi:hypothetical protein